MCTWVRNEEKAESMVDFYCSELKSKDTDRGSDRFFWQCQGRAVEMLDVEGEKAEKEAPVERETGRILHEKWAGR